MGREGRGAPLLRLQFHPIPGHGAKAAFGLVRVRGQQREMANEWAVLEMKRRSQKPVA